MKSIRHLTTILWLLAMVVGQTEWSAATKPSSPFVVVRELVSHSSGGGATTVLLSISPSSSHIKCDEIILSVAKIDNLIYEGPDTLVGFIVDSLPAVFEIKVKIPENDTSGMEFNIRGCNESRGCDIYMVAKDTTVEIHPGDVRKSMAARQAGSKMEISTSHADWLKEKFGDTHETTTILDAEGRIVYTTDDGWFDPDGNSISEEEAQDLYYRKEPPVYGRIQPRIDGYGWIRTDSGLVYMPKTEAPTNEQLRLKKMRELEKEPLTDHSGELYKIGDTVYIRDSGWIDANGNLMSDDEVMELYNRDRAQSDIGCGLPWPISVGLETEPSPAQPGPVNLRLTLKWLLPDKDCDTLEIFVDSIDNLIYNGPQSIITAFGRGEPTELEFPIVLPANDTCGMIIKFKCDRPVQTKWVYWVTKSDTVEFYNGDPRTSQKALYPPTPRRMISPEERPYWEMEQKEQWPHTGSEPEIFLVGDKGFIRNPGEYKFREMDAIEDPKEYMRHIQDSLRAVSLSHINIRTMDLSDTTKYRIARQYADSLLPTDQQGVYQVYFTPSDISQLRDWLFEIHRIKPVLDQ